MDIASFLTELGSGIGAFVPSIVTGMLDAFVGLFFITDTSGAITGMSPLAMVSLSFFVIGLVYKFIPQVLGWLKTASKRRGRKKRK